MSQGKIKFDANKPMNNGKGAKFAAQLAVMAYQSQPEIEKELVEIGYNETKILFFRYELASGFIIEWGDIIAVAFRGSGNIKEWINNFKIKLAPTNVGYLHSGFYQTMENISPTLYRIILPGLLAGSKIITVGHSRGGALALLFASFIHLNGHQVHAVYTFGQPKVGDRNFANWSKANMSIPVHKFVHGLDIVPRLPPSSFQDFYVLFLAFSKFVLYAIPRSVIWVTKKFKSKNG